MFANFSLLNPNDKIEFGESYQWLNNLKSYWIMAGDGTIETSKEACYVEENSSIGLKCLSSDSLTNIELYIRPVVEINISNIKA